VLLQSVDRVIAAIRIGTASARASSSDVACVAAVCACFATSCRSIVAIISCTAAFYLLLMHLIPTQQDVSELCRRVVSDFNASTDTSTPRKRKQRSSADDNDDHDDTDATTSSGVVTAGADLELALFALNRYIVAFPDVSVRCQHDLHDRMRVHSHSIAHSLTCAHCCRVWARWRSAMLRRQARCDSCSCC
jgi:hypothetical protein